MKQKTKSIFFKKSNKEENVLQHKKVQVEKCCSKHGEANCCIVASKKKM